MNLRTMTMMIALFGLTLATTVSAQDTTLAASAPGFYVETSLPTPDLGLEEQVAGTYCRLDVILYVAGMVLCENGDPERKCEDLVIVFVLTDSKCQKGGNVGCSAKVGVFIFSDKNCHGGEGEDGCDFDVTIADPTGEGGNCEGGPGSRFFRTISG